MAALSTTTSVVAALQAI